MNTKYFETNASPGLAYINKAIKELDVKVTQETTVNQLFGMHNAVFARALDLLIEDIKKNKLP